MSVLIVIHSDTTDEAERGILEYVRYKFPERFTETRDICKICHGEKCYKCDEENAHGFREDTRLTAEAQK